MRRCSAGAGYVLQMFEDFSYDPRFGNESHDAEGSSAGTAKGIELENSSNQIRPAPPQCLFYCGAGGLFVFMGVRSSRIGLLLPLSGLTSSSNEVSVVPVIKEQMSLRLRDLSDDSCQELERVDFFEPREKLTRVVMRVLGSVENMRRAWTPLHSG